MSSAHPYWSGLLCRIAGLDYFNPKCQLFYYFLCFWIVISRSVFNFSVCIISKLSCFSNRILQTVYYNKYNIQKYYQETGLDFILIWIILNSNNLIYFSTFIGQLEELRSRQELESRFSAPCFLLRISDKPATVCLSNGSRPTLNKYTLCRW